MPSPNLFGTPAAVMLLTPDGRISATFMARIPGHDMRFGLVDAFRREIGTPIRSRFCSFAHYDPTAAVYSASILKLSVSAGVLTILCIVGGILISRRRESLAAARIFIAPPLPSAPGTRSSPKPMSQSQFCQFIREQASNFAPNVTPLIALHHRDLSSCLPRSPVTVAIVIFYLQISPAKHQ